MKLFEFGNVVIKPDRVVYMVKCWTPYEHVRIHLDNGEVLYAKEELKVLRARLEIALRWDDD